MTDIGATWHSSDKVEKKKFVILSQAHMTLILALSRNFDFDPRVVELIPLHRGPFQHIEEGAHWASWPYVATELGQVSIS